MQSAPNCLLAARVLWHIWSSDPCGKQRHWCHPPRPGLRLVHANKLPTRRCCPAIVAKEVDNLSRGDLLHNGRVARPCQFSSSHGRSATATSPLWPSRELRSAEPRKVRNPANVVEHHPKHHHASWADARRQLELEIHLLQSIVKTGMYGLSRLSNGRVKSANLYLKVGRCDTIQKGGREDGKSSTK